MLSGLSKCSSVDELLWFRSQASSSAGFQIEWQCMLASPPPPLIEYSSKRWNRVENTLQRADWVNFLFFHNDREEAMLPFGSQGFRVYRQAWIKSQLIFNVQLRQHNHWLPCAPDLVLRSPNSYVRPMEQALSLKNLLSLCFVFSMLAS